MSNQVSKTELMIAEFEGPAALIKAAEKIRDAGYMSFDCHSPFPIHGMDKAMGLKRSPLGWIVGMMAIVGGSGAFLLQWWTSAVNYPLIVAGKPFFSFQAYVPVTFGLAVLFGAVSAVLGMLILNKLPRPFHPAFNSSNFIKFSTDGFFVSIEASDPKFDKTESHEFLRSIGGRNIETVGNH
ncbi:MAG: DUF3341 domain-containing protein [candidate division Zixibacteria bacterium CG_4_9_14_3_um_filter_46_8]|nr:MAG: DUF3341 domain-containing protein [candidate division Zixibacteria bacterium CG_4_9_14_3_um_filter_46_8]